MSLLIPPSVNYGEQWTSQPSFLRAGPAPEGDRQASFEIDWATMGGSNNAVNFNLLSGSVNPLSRICALAIDNSDCGMDVRFLFTDTQTTVTVGAGQPSLIIPVFTNQTSFIVVGTINNEAEEPKDVTRFSVCNFVPPPIAVPPTGAQELGALSFTTLDATASTTLIAAGSAYDSGTVEGITVNYAGAASGSGVNSCKIQDGTGKDIAWFQVAATSGQIYNVPILNLVPLSVRYSGGLFLKQSGTAIGGQVSINIPVKLP